MTISRQNITVVIVTFKSDDVIHDCIMSIPNDINIFVVDNAGDSNFKENIEKNYKNVSCILSSENLGMGSGNNFGLKQVKTDYALILNPDVILDKNTIDELIISGKIIDDFAIISPLSKNEAYPNFKNINGNVYDNSINPFKVKSVDGYSMLLNIKKINQLKGFENLNYFDENIFLYLENDDLCKRLYDLNENIYVVPKSKIYHIGASAVNKKFSHQVEVSRKFNFIFISRINSFTS